MKLSKTAIRELSKMYRAVLMGALLVSLFGTAESNATTYYVASESGGANTTQINIGTAASKAIGDFDPANAASNAKTAIENKLTTNGGSTGYDIDAKSISTNLGNGPQGGPVYGTADLGDTTVQSISTYQYTGSLDENDDPIKEYGSAELGDTTVYGTTNLNGNASINEGSLQVGFNDNATLDPADDSYHFQVDGSNGDVTTDGTLKAGATTVSSISTSNGETNPSYGTATLGATTINDGALKVVSGGSDKFKVDTEGDVTSNSLFAAGNVTLGDTTSDTIKINGTTTFNEVVNAKGGISTSDGAATPTYGEAILGDTTVNGKLSAGATTVSSISTSDGATTPNYGSADLGTVTVHNGEGIKVVGSGATGLQENAHMTADGKVWGRTSLGTNGSLSVGLVSGGDTPGDDSDDSYHFQVNGTNGNVMLGFKTAPSETTPATYHFQIEGSSGNVTTDGNLKLGGITGNSVNTIDNGTTAQTSDGTTTMATVATVLKSAENATYTATGPNLPTGTTRTINTAIDTLDEKMGKVAELGTYLEAKGNLTNGGTTPPTTVVQALENIDQSMGKIHGLANANGTVNNTKSTVGNGTNLAKGTTVEDHLVSLDNAIGNRTITSANGTINAATATSLSAGLRAAGDQIGSLNYSTTHYVRQGANITDAISALDFNLDRVENKVEKMDKQMKSGFASMAALNGLKPNARACNDTQIAIGAGHYRGQTGFALGGFHYVNDNLMLNIGAGYAGNQSTTVSGGLTFGW